MYLDPQLRWVRQKLVALCKLPVVKQSACADHDIARAAEMCSSPLISPLLELLPITDVWIVPLRRSGSITIHTRETGAIADPVGVGVKVAVANRSV